MRVGGQRVFQYTALDDCTRYRVLRLYRRLNHQNSIDFFRQVQGALPFQIRQVQTDNGNEFHRIDHEEFWSRQHLASYGQAENALRAWEQHYNVERFSMALQSQTPADKLAARLAA